MLLCCSVVGFRWYSILPVIIYLGGFYILFILVSISYPNVAPYSGFSFYGFCLVWLSLMVFFYLLSLCKLLYLDCCEVICSSVEALTYCFVGVSIIFGFAMISMITSNKSSFYR